MNPRNAMELGRIWGIPVGLDWSWFLVFGLVTWSLAVGYFPGEYPALGPAALWLLGAATAVLFFGSVLVHELAHAAVALRNGVPVKAINLHIFGGVALLDKEPPSAGAEFRITIAGPLSSLALAAGFGGLYLLDRGVDWLAAPSIWLARINLMLALFNLIPGFPLDGGRILRALVWQIDGDAHRATRVAAFTGRLVAFGFIGYGVYLALGGNLFNGAWLVFIGWFLHNAALAAGVQSDVERSLGGVPVERVMRRDWARVAGTVPLDRLVIDQVLSGGRRFALVEGTGAGDGAGRTMPTGLVSVTNLRGTPREGWGRTTVAEAMVPWSRVVRVEANADLLTALLVMAEAGVTQVPVMSPGGAEAPPVGILSRDDVTQYLRVRRELGV